MRFITKNKGRNFFEKEDFKSFPCDFTNHFVNANGICNEFLHEN